LQKNADDGSDWEIRIDRKFLPQDPGYRERIEVNRTPQDVLLALEKRWHELVIRQEARAGTDAAQDCLVYTAAFADRHVDRLIQVLQAMGGIPPALGSAADPWLAAFAPLALAEHHDGIWTLTRRVVPSRGRPLPFPMLALFAGVSFLMGEELSRSHEHNGARECFEWSLGILQAVRGARNPVTIPALIALGDIHMNLKEAGEARIYFKRALALMRREDEATVTWRQKALIGLAAAHNQCNSLVGEAECLAELVDLLASHGSPELNRFRLLLGMNYTIRRRHRFAEGLFRRIIAEEGHLPMAQRRCLGDAWMALGNLLADVERFAEAVTSISQAIDEFTCRLGPDHEKTHQARRLLHMLSVLLQGKDDLH
jgi:hypothetical protein